MKYLWLLLLPSLSFADTLDIRVQIKDSILGVPFNDAIYYKPGQIDLSDPGALSDPDAHLDKILPPEFFTERQRRIAVVEDAIKNPPPPPPEPTKEELEKQAAIVSQDILSLQQQLLDLNQKISEKDADEAAIITP